MYVGMRAATVLTGNKQSSSLILFFFRMLTYDHRLRRTGHPVRSAIHKPQIGRSVVGWVTTSESLLLYVHLLFAIFSIGRSFLESFCFCRKRVIYMFI